MEQTTSKRTYNISFFIMLFCIFCFTVGQFIPIYFTDTGFRTLFYFFIYILLVIAVSRTIFKRIHKSQKENVSSAWFYSILIGFATFVIFGLWTLGLFFSVWTEASTLYVKKDNPKIKIIRRYVNEGAFGGGTEKEDYHIVLHRPFLWFFKMETSIDTLTMTKNEWRTPDLYNLNDIKGVWYLYNGMSNDILNFKDTSVLTTKNNKVINLKYTILQDSLIIYSADNNYKAKYKIYSFSKDDLMINSDTSKTGLNQYYRTKK